MKLRTTLFAIISFCIVVFAVYMSGVSTLPTEALSDKSNPPTELRQYTVVTTTTKKAKQSKPKMVDETTTQKAKKKKKKKKKTETTATAAATTTTKAPEKIFPDSDLEMMAVVIYREAGGNAYSNKTRIMVGNVVMNRVRSSRFPNTIYGVLTQRGQYAGMSGAINWPSMASNRWERDAVKRAWACARRVQAGENYLPANVVYQSDYRNLGSGVYCVADGMYFNYM